MKTVDKYNIFKLFGLKVDYVAENDMAATSIDGVLEAVAQQANECTVKVRNLGSKNQENYTVKLLMDNEGKMVEVGTGTGTELLKTGETADVKVSFNPPYDGVWDFYGVVVANGDEVRTNDTTAVKTVKVLEAGSQGWTNIVTTGHKEGLSFLRSVLERLRERVLSERLLSRGDQDHQGWYHQAYRLDVRRC